MKISVIIPVFNVENYLKQCIDSVLAQSYKNLEILLINDGSTDNSEIICREYEGEFSNITLINKENSGQSDARNVGILNSTGEYIIFLDSDDYWGMNFLKDLVKEIEGNQGLDFIFFRYQMFYHLKRVFKEPDINICKKKIDGISGKECLEHIFGNNKEYNWFAVLYLVRREFVIQNNLFFEMNRNYEDMLWTPQIFLKAKNVKYYDKPIYVYRLGRDGSITASFSKKSIKDSIFISSFWHEELRKYDIEDNLKANLLNNFSTRYYVSIWFSGLLNKNEKKEVVTMLKEHQYLLKYGKEFKKKLTALMCEIIGFNACIAIFKILIKVKRKLK
ncbi:hypothetical protein CSE16_04895 [Solibacillus sp. R5-41]|uniref:glycosyltransferase family 2 protein n=1 Tax=Solibacillus sp. R5-41 TaxID=2048654 RepID=UPI000C1258FB|nr:glycosyltransferase [Solibacillus sp. R5-41]ATP39435.1 hypothetical protein CSE16_04895 [Solibacillus sp. R5-41]